LSLIAKVPRRCADAVATTVLTLLKPLTLPLHTLTSENGREFAQHETIAKALRVRFFFAHPYAAWERGLKENTNGLIRQYFPQQRPFATISQEEIRVVMDKLNNRPSKSLGFTPPQSSMFWHSSICCTSELNPS